MHGNEMQEGMNSMYKDTSAPPVLSCIFPHTYKYARGIKGIAILKATHSSLTSMVLDIK